MDKVSGIDLSGQTALVTGGGRGIGRAIALALAAHGAKVAVLARSQDEVADTVRLIEAAGGRAAGIHADVADRTQMHSALEQAEVTLGPIDLLVNNAGALRPLGPFAENDPEEWWRTFEVNVRGPALCSHAVLPGMIARRRGRIVTVASGAGANVILPYFSAYVTSKTAALRFCEALSLELKEHGIAVFAISPGSVHTAMTDYSLNSAEGKRWLPWFRAIYDEGRNVPAERAAELVVALASGKADALSGRYIAVADDLDRMVAQAQTIARDALYALRSGKLADA
jgi:NAD(P)-dependent dehydrogenase (short-subunit alcohol dehydrogenase family)